jgi:hypothetical protein
MEDSISVMVEKNYAASKKVKLQVYVSSVDFKHLEEDCGSLGMNPSELIRDIVRKYYNQKLGRG